jgi:Zn-dependent M32 family carboxypeptidase
MMDNKAQARRVMIYFDMHLKPGELIRSYSTIYRAALLYDRVGEMADFDRLGKVAELLAIKEISREPFSYNDPANPYDMLLDYYIKSGQKDKMIQLLKDLNERYPDDQDIVEKLKALSGG